MVEFSSGILRKILNKDKELFTQKYIDLYGLNDRAKARKE